MAETYEKEKLYQLPLTRLIPDPEQPRKFFDEQSLAELAASIASHGVLQPILVHEGGTESSKCQKHETRNFQTHISNSRLDRPETGRSV